VVLRAWDSDGASPPGHYYGFGSASVSVVDQGEISGVSLRLEPVVEGLIAGRASIPAELATPRVEAYLWLAFDRYEQLLLQSSPVAPENFAVVVPSVAGAEGWIRIHAVGPDVRVAAPSSGLAFSQSWHQRRAAAPSSSLGFSLPAPPELLEPAAGAAVGGATVFRWTPGEPGGSSALSFVCEWPETGFASYFIEADGVAATLPEIPGIAVPPGAACRWAVLWCADAAVATLRDDPAAEKRCSWSMERAATSL
jgi:hypothetical protein